MVASILEEVCRENDRSPAGDCEASFQGFIETLDGSDTRYGIPLISKDFARELQGFQTTAFAAVSSSPNEPSATLRMAADRKTANDWWNLIVELVEMFYEVERGDKRVWMPLFMIALAAHLDQLL